jgi:Protein of unknown function (DUF1501)
MFSFLGPRQRPTCDGVDRRTLLKLGALGFGGLALPDVLRLQARGNSTTPRQKSVILVLQFGGPSHLDTYDMKPDAPSDIRGEFKPIKSKVPGWDVCELLPKQATVTDKMTIVRSVQMAGNDHFHPSEIFTGVVYNHLTKSGLIRPVIGSIVSKVRGLQNNVPPYVSLRGDPAFEEEPAYLGTAHRPFVAKGPGLENLTLPKGFTPGRFEDRKGLLRTFDTLRREVDGQGRFEGMDEFKQKAFDLLASPRTHAAFDLKNESPRVVDKYGKMKHYLLARRLVEAGVSLVTLDASPNGAWDTHEDNFKKLRVACPEVDLGLTTLVEDIHDHGLDKDVLVVMWGEFGRSPKISGNAGRDHWPEANYVIFSGGGFPMGQVIGATDRIGARPTEKPYRAQNVLATIYQFLGIDPSQTFMDNNGRPTHVLDDVKPIAELV